MQRSDYMLVAAVAGGITSSLIITSSSSVYWPLAGFIAIASVIMSESGFQKFLMRESTGIKSVIALNGRVLPEVLVVLAVASTSIVPSSAGLLAVGLLLYTDVLSLEMVHRSNMSYSRIFDHRIRLTVVSTGLILSFIDPNVLTWSLFVLIGLTLYEGVRTNFKLSNLA